MVGTHTDNECMYTCLKDVVMCMQTCLARSMKLMQGTSFLEPSHSKCL